MDTGTAAVIVVVIFALVIIAAFMFFRNTRATVKGPFGTELEIDGSNDAPPKPHDIEISDATAGDDILAENEGDGGIGISRVKTDGGIVATNKKSTDDPKANPPT